MAAASTNLLVQPFVLMIGAGILIWLLGYSAIVGIGVSIPHRGLCYAHAAAVTPHGSSSR